MASEGSRLSARLRTWWHATNFFDNTQNLVSISRFAISLQEVIMAAKKTGANRDFQRGDWQGFLEYRLSDAELLAAAEWEVSDTDIVEAIVNLIAKGYNLKTSYSVKTGAATATLIAGQEQGKLSGWAVSAKGTDGRDALKLLFYKHYHALDEDWTPLLDVGRPVARG